MRKLYQPELRQEDINEWLEQRRRGKSFPQVQAALAERTREWWKGRKPTAKAVMSRWRI